MSTTRTTAHLNRSRAAAAAMRQAEAARTGAITGDPEYWLKLAETIGRMDPEAFTDHEPTVRRVFGDHRNTWAVISPAGDEHRLKDDNALYAYLGAYYGMTAVGTRQLIKRGAEADEAA
ncbi:hypothetical protein [Nocardiopsis halophila]|uniref:hypothetical protein n=1 Tax=Nocardiopsis halophila TaxID=141692 RepID=UPI0003457634|nr:hypothetical protein [Nocardiopsis halophila]